MLLGAIAVLDFACVAATGLALKIPGENTLAMPAPWGWLLIIMIAGIGVASLQGQRAYSVDSMRSLRGQLGQIALSQTVLFGGVMAIVFAGDVPVFARDFLVKWMVISSLCLSLARPVLVAIVEKLSQNGRLALRTVIAGGGANAEALIQAFQASGKRDVDILGIFDDRRDERGHVKISGYERLGTFEDLSACCRSGAVDLIIVTLPLVAQDRLLTILKRYWELPVDVRLSITNVKLPIHSRAYTFIGGVPLLAVFDKPLTDWQWILKSVVDRVLAFVLCVAAAPAMAMVAIALKLEGCGPVLFKQERYGFNNEPIEVFKFRSMVVNDNLDTGHGSVMKNDPRVTRVGRFIRKTSLDELPQLFNVLRGELALVGPRPHAKQSKSNAQIFELAVEGYFARHRMKPGITGWAQVNGWRGETDTHAKLMRRVEHDLYYIEHWSVLFDLGILALTPLAVLSGKNAQ